MQLTVLGTRTSVNDEVVPRPKDFGQDGLTALTDARGRAYTYLRLSVTDRCDLACVYCMPKSGETEHGTRPELLTFEEATRIARVLAQMGVRRVRLTGGEPLVRKDVVELVRMLHDEARISELVLTTNATRLAELAEPLARAGLRAVNVSIDSLDAARFERITRGGDLTRVLAGIHAAIAAGLAVKLNVVALAGENEDELEGLVDFAWSVGATPRFIELMPLGEGAKLPPSKRLSADRIVTALGKHLDVDAARQSELGHGPARYLPARDGSPRKVGFITAMSEQFCDDCNRVRITARGEIRACLASRRAVSLRDVARRGGSDLDIAWAVTWALGAKDSGHRFLEPHVDEHEHVGMSLIGG